MAGDARGFTLLEMMLVVLLIGGAASLVMMSFPADRREDAAYQLARFQAQLDFAADNSQLHEQLLGISIYPDRWQFNVLQRRQSAQSDSGDEAWRGYRWQPWQPRRLAASAQLPPAVRLELHLSETGEVNKQPAVLILPGGEITPFKLIFHNARQGISSWLQVDDSGRISTSLSDDGGTAP